ncbi:unnamed protein product [Didymodactylos carnosus]|uniref:EGF-like domain-containing protein n=1 Tax=Didymodactylos carnosus TaxID=1234261 RepID=A0A815MUN3_9BILA|nr:unnamed protein product [Didymodactylos carnosus]CAF4306715.1 unnamed protein product [Didymodactylos carnosus]
MNLIWYCNRGILIETHNISDFKCFCPPTYYGDRCQYQSERLTLYMQIQTSSSSFNRSSVFRFIIYLFNDRKNSIIIEEQIVCSSYYQSSYRHVIYLLYPRSKLIYKTNYFVQISSYLISYSNVKFISSWYYNVLFSFLPVNRLAINLILDNKLIKHKYCSKQQNKCIHGICIVYSNSQTHSYCLCNENWTGSLCNIRLNCSKFNCSEGSKCNNNGKCICQSGKFGNECYDTFDRCKDNNKNKYLPALLIHVQLYFNNLIYSYYLAALLKQDNIQILNTTISSLNYCPNVNDLLNKTIVKYSPLKRVKYYHYVCKTNNTNIKCFYDESYMCLCDNDKLPDCYIFSHSINNCYEDNYCQNQAQCIQNIQYGEHDFVCVCQECGYVVVLLKYLPVIFYWLTACIALERAVTIVKGATMNKNLSIKMAKILIFLAIMISLSYIYDPFNRQLIEDPRLDGHATKYDQKVLEGEWPWRSLFDLVLSPDDEYLISFTRKHFRSQKVPLFNLFCHNLGVVSRQEKQYDLALEHFDRSNEIKQKYLPSDHPHQATTINNIGYIYRCQGLYQQSLKQHEKAVEIRLKYLPEQHPS